MALRPAAPAGNGNPARSLRPSAGPLRTLAHSQPLWFSQGNRLPHPHCHAPSPPPHTHTQLPMLSLCSLTHLRDAQEDPWNAIGAGAMTGGFLQLRFGLGSAAKSAMFGGFLLVGGGGGGAGGGWWGGGLWGAGRMVGGGSVCVWGG